MILILIIGVAVYLAIGIIGFLIIMLMEFNDAPYNRRPDMREILDVGFMVIICWGFWLAYIVIVVVIYDGWIEKIKQFVINIYSTIIKEVLR